MWDCAERGISLNHRFPAAVQQVSGRLAGIVETDETFAFKSAQGRAETEPLSAAARCASAASRATGIDTGCHRPARRAGAGPPAHPDGQRRQMS